MTTVSSQLRESWSRQDLVWNEAESPCSHRATTSLAPQPTAAPQPRQRRERTRHDKHSSSTNGPGSGAVIVDCPGRIHHTPDTGGPCGAAKSGTDDARADDHRRHRKCRAHRASSSA